ncbi:hypothetical protein ACFLUJ_06835 [Chloroflexota bacterium]
MESIETEIGKESCVKMILSAVQVNNPSGLRFWQKNGYRIMGEPELQSDLTTVFHLRKDLQV